MTHNSLMLDEDLIVVLQEQGILSEQSSHSKYERGGEQVSRYIQVLD